jgi:hypothetical protein
MTLSVSLMFSPFGLRKTAPAASLEATQEAGGSCEGVNKNFCFREECRAYQRQGKIRH